MTWDTHARRRARPSGSAQAKLRALVLKRDGFTCQLRFEGCTNIAHEVDHIVPWEQGGEHAPDNAQAVCPSCHALKTQREAHAGRWGWKRPAARHPGLDPLV